MSSCGQVHSLLLHPLWVFAPQTTSQGNLSSLAYLKLQLLASLTGAHFFIFYFVFPQIIACISYSVWAYVLSRFSLVCLYMTLWTVAARLLSPWDFSRQKYWSGLPCPPQGYSQSRDRTCIILCLLHCRPTLYPLSYLGSVIFCKHLCMYFAYWMPSSICPQWGLEFMSVWIHRASTFPD